tara:strand:+ start:3159 stop:3806 length:648 start_codon:yes stop_codon:yes gene_type:complete
MNKYKNAREAFENIYNDLCKNGLEFDNTKALFNVGFTILNPLDNKIDTEWRNWSETYAKAEWDWYLSGDPRVSKLGDIYGKTPAIWERMADGDGVVNSNYGYQWQRRNQLDKVVEQLIKNPQTRKAAISIYDGKEIHRYGHDTPCTYAIQFTIVNNKLNMSVYMRSNDIWFGFCNDQYCFSMLQKLVSDRTGYEVGEYYHHAHNMHVYNNFLDKA